MASGGQFADDRRLVQRFNTVKRIVNGHLHAGPRNVHDGPAPCCAGMLDDLPEDDAPRSKPPTGLAIESKVDWMTISSPKPFGVKVLFTR